MKFTIDTYTTKRRSPFDPKNKLTARLLEAQQNGASDGRLFKIVLKEMRQGRLVPSVYVLGPRSLALGWGDEQGFEDTAVLDHLTERQMQRLCFDCAMLCEESDDYRIDKKTLARLQAQQRIRTEQEQTRLRTN